MSYDRSKHPSLTHHTFSNSRVLTRQTLAPLPHQLAPLSKLLPPTRAGDHVRLPTLVVRMEEDPTPVVVVVEPAVATVTAREEEQASAVSRQHALA